MLPISERALLQPEHTECLCPGDWRSVAGGKDKRISQLGGQMTALVSHFSVTQSSPTSGLMQSPVAQRHSSNVPSQTTAYAYLYRCAVGHGCDARNLV